MRVLSTKIRVKTRFFRCMYDWVLIITEELRLFRCKNESKQEIIQLCHWISEVGQVNVTRSDGPISLSKKIDQLVVAIYVVLLLPGQKIDTLPGVKTLYYVLTSSPSGVQFLFKKRLSCRLPLADTECRSRSRISEMPIEPRNSLFSEGPSMNG